MKAKNRIGLLLFSVAMLLLGLGAFISSEVEYKSIGRIITTAAYVLLPISVGFQIWNYWESKKK